MPIEKAMQTIVAHGRMGASPDIMPSASRDLAPLQGWSKMPAEVPPAMMAAPPATVDAGAHAVAPGDAGSRTMGTDAGAPRKPTKKQP